MGAIIVRDDTILIAQRRTDDSFPGKWEFPGGKVDAGEDERQALRREIMEELGVSVEVGEKVAEIDHEYEQFSVSLSFYRCSLIDAEEPRAKVHQTICWGKVENLTRYDFLEADVSLVRKLSLLLR